MIPGQDIKNEMKAQPWKTATTTEVNMFDLVLLNEWYLQKKKECYC